MIVKAAHRRPEGLVSRLKSDGSPLTSDCLNISNYLKSLSSNLVPSDYLCILKSVILTQLKMESIFLTQHVELKMS